jgi:ABC-2 type transport system ATP-binding protein
VSDETAAIQIDRVTKQYGSFTAVGDISLAIRRGSLFGLLGPNGAGKTTTIRMIMNITAPDSGSIRIFGREASDKTSRGIGYLPEERGLYRKMKVLEHIVFLGEIRGLRARAAKKTAEEWMEKLSILEWKDRKVEELSKGMQQKIQFIGCVIHDPEVLILDEPFSGLDPVNARVLKETLLEFREQGKTIVLSTHVMEHAEKLCDEIALIDRSKIVLEGSIGELKRQHSLNRLMIRGSGEHAAFRDLTGVRSVVTRDGVIEIDLDPATTTAAFLREATGSRFEFESVVPHEISLDDIFVKVVGHPVDETGVTAGGEA